MCEVFHSLLKFGRASPLPGRALHERRAPVPLQDVQEHYEWEITPN